MASRVARPAVSHTSFVMVFAAAGSILEAGRAAADDDVKLPMEEMKHVNVNDVVMAKSGSRVS